jgi:preprotein translocase subunit SecB
MMAEQQQPKFEINRVYVKDVSFESPQAPQVFLESNQFAVDVAVDTRPRHIEKDFYEVALKVTVTAKKDKSDDVVYIAEASQAGVFTISNFNDEQKNQVLNSACANILFPFIRETIANLVYRGGFPQLYLAPINFDALYMQQQERAKQEAGQATGKAGHA